MKNQTNPFIGQVSLTLNDFIEIFKLNTKLQIFIICLSFILIPNLASAQYNDVNFGGSGVNISYYPTGSDGTDQGDIILYENVATVSGQSIDCYVVVDSVTGSGLSDPDQNSTSGSGYSNNKQRFFSPFLNLPSGGGTACFSFQFVQDGTFGYTSSTNTISGTNVTIDSVLINSYDLDGNGAANSNQFTEFGGFATSELSLTTNLSFTTSSTTGLTKWVSTKTANTSVVTAPENRIRVFYDTMSSFQIAVGAGASGWGYFFLEFAAGINFPNTVTYYKIKGNVLNDSNGLHGNSIIDGLPVSTAETTQLYASLVNSGDSVLESVAIGADGSYAFNVVVNGSYKVILSKTQLSVNSTGNSPSLPTNWEFIGENIGRSSGNDGTNNGKISVTVNRSNITEVNFGINKRPESTYLTQQIVKPGFGDSIFVGDPSLSALKPKGTDHEDGAIINPSVLHINSLPSGTNKLIYNGVEITVGADGTNPPSATNPFVISSFDNTKLKFEVNEGESVEFTYSVVDAAGLVDATPALYQYTWIGPVPVDFVGVDAELIEDDLVEVSWLTASELNNEKFEILRKLDDAEEFSLIGVVQGAGNSNRLLEYSYSDNIDIPFGRVCYIIRQVDFDGKNENSDVACVSAKRDQVINIYPNPANNKLIVDLGELENTFGQLEMFDQTGRVVRSKEIAEYQVLDVSNLEPGIYIVTVTNGPKTRTTRVVIGQ